MTWSASAVFLVVLSLLAAALAEDPQPMSAEAATSVGLRPFFVGCPDNLGGTSLEDEVERHQGHWFFKPRTLKEHSFQITYSSLGNGNATRCDPVLGPLVVSKWAGLGRGMIKLAPRSVAGDKYLVDLSSLEKGVEYYLVDTFQDAWQRYRGYRSITLE